MFSYTINGSPITSCATIKEAYRAIEDTPRGRCDQPGTYPAYTIWEHNTDGTLSLADINGDI